ncbi:MAG: ABC transporter ATP-binding protein [Firmicutes bacterium]|nr:ABC transporter ATP-binding protein [Bacillota bacterium]
MIRVNNVIKSFDGFPALNGLSLNVKKGSIYGLVGVNGSGKTTIIKHLIGAYKQDEGEVLVSGEAIYDNVAVKEKVAYISDDLYFFGLYSLKGSAAYYKKLYPNWNWERYAHMVQQFGLNEKVKLSKFSKGMQKQAAFILAMSSMPEVLILDEPIDGLDPLIRRLVIKYIVEDVAEREMTVLVSSHNLKEMEDLCDSIGIINKGQMLIERDLDDLKSDVHKIQVVFPEGEEASLEGLEVLFREKRGSVELFIIRGEREKIENNFKKSRPIVYDLLPLTLEEIFVYETGGENDELKEILF